MSDPRPQASDLADDLHEGLGDPGAGAEAGPGAPLASGALDGALAPWPRAWARPRSTVVSPLAAGARVVVVELCAGMAGLTQSLLAQSAVEVLQVHLVDSDPLLSPLHSALMRRWAPQLAHSVQPSITLPSDVGLIRPVHVEALLRGVPADAHVVLLAGPPCQHRSAAGRRLGVADTRHAVVRHCARVIALFQRRWPGRCHYVVENVPGGQAGASAGVLAADREMEALFGPPVVFDAAVVGSLATRVRAFFTNLCPPPVLSAVVARVGADVAVRRAAGSLPTLPAVMDSPARSPHPAATVWPTFTCRLGSFPYGRLTSRGRVRVAAGGGTAARWDEPSAAERGRAMGFPEGYLDGVGLSETDRIRLMGQTVDQHAAGVLWQAVFSFSASVPTVAAAWAELGEAARADAARAAGEAAAANGARGAATAEMAAVCAEAHAAAGATARCWEREPPVWATAAYQSGADRTGRAEAVRWMRWEEAERAADPLAFPLWEAEEGDTAWGVDAETLRTDPAALSALARVLAAEPAGRRAAAEQALHAGVIPWGGEALVAAVTGLDLPAEATHGSAAVAVREQEQLGSELLESLGDDGVVPLASGLGRAERAAQVLRALSDAEKRLTPPQLAAAQALLLEYLEKGLFAFDLADLGEAVAPPMEIRLQEGARPIHQKARRLPDDQREAVEAELRQLLEHNIIRRSQSPWAANLLMVRKKDGTLRMCVDYRPVNRVTMDWRYPMADVQQILDRVGAGRCTFFSAVDLYKGYWQTVIKEEDRVKTAFSSPLGQFEFTRTPFGLKTAPAYFWSLVDELCQPLPDSHGYMDDVLTATAGFDAHVSALRAFFDAVLAKGLRLNPKKCAFFAEEVDYVGHRVSAEGHRPLQSTVDAIRRAPVPANVKGVRQFLGLTGYLRRYVQAYSAIAQPLTRLLKKDTVWEWGPEQQRADAELRRLLTEAPVLRFVDPARPLRIATDWSVDGVGAVLSQLDDEGREYVCAYISKSCTSAERRYSAFKGELLAVLWACEKWRHYIGSREVELVTDHRALEWLFTAKELPPMLARWVLRLDELNLRVVHRPGTENAGPDYLSRNPVPPAAGPPSDAALTAAECFAVELRAGGVLPADHTCEVRALPESAVLRWALALAALAEEEAQVQARAELGGGYPEPDAWVPLERAAAWQGHAAFAARAMADPDGDEEEAADEEAVLDPASDAHMLLWLRGGSSAVAELPAAERQRAQRRARRYCWEDLSGLQGPGGERAADGAGRLLRLFEHGRSRVVPALAERAALVEEVHARGVVHAGVKRTYAALASHYWWPGMFQQVLRAVRSCPSCDLQKAARPARYPILQPLPIRPLFTRLSFDLAGPFAPSAAGSRYVLVCVEHLSRMVELAALPDKTALSTRRAAAAVFGRYGAVAEVLTDGGPEWQGEFAQLLEEFRCDHRKTTGYHPQANGLTERCVQTVKALLTRALAADPGADWGDLLPRIMLAYNTTPQAGTGLAPYLILFGRLPLLPAHAAERWRRAIDVMDPAMAAEDLLQRLPLLSQAVITAMSNLEAAQQRDRARYAWVRGGGYTGAVRQLAPGKFVYLHDPRATALQPGAQPDIYQVVEVSAGGVVTLMGRNGALFSEQVHNLRECHLPNIDTRLDLRLRDADYDTPCEVCAEVTARGVQGPMLLCDSCASGWHLRCLQHYQRGRGLPALRAVPGEGVDWYCPRCVAMWRVRGPVAATGEALISAPAAAR